MTKFKVGDKVKFKSPKEVKRLLEINTYGIMYGYIDDIVKSGNTFKVEKISHQKGTTFISLDVKRQYKYYVGYYYPDCLFVKFSEKINKLLKI